MLHLIVALANAAISMYKYVFNHTAMLQSHILKNTIFLHLDKAWMEETVLTQFILNKLACLHEVL